MKSQTSLVARKCRLNEWARMVHDCKNRPAGMSVDEWCELNSITKANYYYRMKQVRIACLDALPSEESEHAVVPVPLELMEESTSVSTVSSNNTSYLVIARTSASFLGHTNFPCSRRLYKRRKPSFSQTRPLMRSALRPQKR